MEFPDLHTGMRPPQREAHRGGKPTAEGSQEPIRTSDKGITSRGSGWGSHHPQGSIVHTDTTCTWTKVPKWLTLIGKEDTSTARSQKTGKEEGKEEGGIFERTQGVLE